MTAAEALNIAEERLTRAGLESPQTEALALLEHLLHLSRSELHLSRARVLTPTETARLEGWLGRREKHEPLQHITGVAHFYGLELRVTPDTLIPRPETERLVELGLEALKGVTRPNVLDVGTGSGAVALALKNERPDASVWATDLSRAALEVAEGNAQRLGLEVSFTLSDLLAAPTVQRFAQSVDLLLSNPPYLPEGDAAWLSPEVQRDPPGALFSGRDGLRHFRQLSAQALGLLKPGAVCLLELDPRNVRQAQNESKGWAEATVHTDLVGRERFLRLSR